MGAYESQAAFVIGPYGGVSFPTAGGYDTLAGTTAEDSTAAMPVGAMCTILVGNAAVRFNLRGTAGAANQVADTDPILAANTRYDYMVTDASTCVYVQSADGSAAYQVWVWVSSG